MNLTPCLVCGANNHTDADCPFERAQNQHAMTHDNLDYHADATPKRRNTSYVIKLEAPLLRPGLSITLGPVSEKYVAEETKKAMELVRQINEG